MSDPYAVDAGFYDLVHDARRDDVGLWQSFATRTDAPVLEIGCGTGRIAVELALVGARVTGLDPSPAMLARARPRAEDAGVAVSWVEGTLPGADLPADTFGFALLPADVFLYCRDGDEQVAWLAALAACLRFNGTLAVDVPGPALGLDPASNGEPILAWSGEDADGSHLDVWHVHEDDLGDQIRWLRVTYEQETHDGLVRRYRSEHRLRYPYRFELEYLLRLAGLAVLDVYGDYDLGPLTNSSERMIVTARRVHG